MLPSHAVGKNTHLALAQTANESEVRSCGQHLTGEMEFLWRKLTLEEKRYLLTRPLFDTHMDAARYIRRGKSWLDTAQRKAHFRKAIEARPTWDNSEVGRLLDEDLRLMLRVDIAGYIEENDATRSQKLSAGRLLTQLSRAGVNSNDAQHETYPAVTTVVAPDWMTRAKVGGMEPGVALDLEDLE